MKKIFRSFINMKQSFKGFTLIELMIAISIVAILATIGFNAFTQSQVRARDAKRKQDIRAIAQALDLFYQRNNRYPCSGAATMQNSTASQWLFDVAGCGSATATGDLIPTFINIRPLDPDNTTGTASTATALNYTYYSINSPGNSNAACPVGQYYILGAHLENDNDPDTIQNRDPFSFCGSNNFWTGIAQSGTVYSGNTFVITVP